jgi:hypothetical protein
VGGGTVSPTPGGSNTLERFPFNTPFTVATDIGDLLAPYIDEAGTGQLSLIDGYISGGLSDVTVQRFPFSTPFTVTTDVGDLVEGTGFNAGVSSSISGYSLSGFSTSNTRIVQSFPFASPFTTAVTVGNLTQYNYSNAGSNSLTDGYRSGGMATSSPFVPTATTDTIDRFPFAAPFTTATDIGNLTALSDGVVGLQS